MLIIINGTVGVGKSTTAEALHWKFDRSVYIDGDSIGNVNPFEIYDDARVDHLYRTLALLIGFHQKHGYQNFVFNYVFESNDSLEQLLDLLRPLDSSIHVYWLTCEAKEREQRIRGRRGDGIEWELKRSLELDEILRKASQEGFIGIEVDTTQLNSSETAEKIWKEIFCSG